MKHAAGLAVLGALWAGAGMAAERTIVVPSSVAVSWGALTQSTQMKPSRTLGVGFWQRASGAKPGVGELFASAMEFQLPEAAPARVRSASFQFSGKPSQCVGAEPVVVDVYAYEGDGRGDVGDLAAGTRIAQLSADCADHAAFSRPIDVTPLVRRLSVASGVRFVGFNMRKANHRQGPGLFALVPGRLTVVLADHAELANVLPGRGKTAAPAVAAAPAAPAPAAAPPAVAAAPAASEAEHRRRAEWLKALKRQAVGQPAVAQP